MEKIPVIITTEYRGVFFGKIEEKNFTDTTLMVSDCRMVLRWSSEVNGFQGLSSHGPTTNCSIARKAGDDVVLHKITSVNKCSPQAAAKWETYA